MRRGGRDDFSAFVVEWDHGGRVAGSGGGGGFTLVGLSRSMIAVEAPGWRGATKAHTAGM